MRELHQPAVRQYGWQAIRKNGLRQTRPRQSQKELIELFKADLKALGYKHVEDTEPARFSNPPYYMLYGLATAPAAPPTSKRPGSAKDICPARCSTENFEPNCRGDACVAPFLNQSNNQCLIQTPAIDIPFAYWITIIHKRAHICDNLFV